MVVVHPFLSKLALPLVVLFCSFVSAETVTNGDHRIGGYLARIRANDAAELQSILMRAEEIFQQNGSFNSNQPLALVLHGNEANVFLRNNYDQYRELVDQAARLEAFNVINVQICETWLSRAAVDKDELPAFVDTVPYGPARKRKLLERGFEYF